MVGVDSAPSLLSRAREMAANLHNVTFQEADARALPFEEATFDVVVFDSTLTHVPGPERALAEAFRVLRPSGYLAAFDGDYATTTVASGDHDPLQGAWTRWWPTPCMIDGSGGGCPRWCAAADLRWRVLEVMGSWRRPRPSTC